MAGLRGESSEAIDRGGGPGVGASTPGASGAITISEPRYCRRCSYDLRLLPAGACPECGRAFDPKDRKSFRSRPRMAAGWRRVFQLMMLLAGLTTIASAALETWRWMRIKSHSVEVAAADALKARGAVVLWKTTENPTWLEARLGLQQCLNHVWIVEFRWASGMAVRAEDLQQLQAFDRLERLLLFRLKLEKGALLQVRCARTLKLLSLDEAHWPEKSSELLDLSELTQLEELSMQGTLIDDSSIKGLAGLSQMRILNLWNTHVGDGTALEISKLPSLERLNLIRTHISNAGVARLASLGRLKSLALSNNKSLDDTGLQHLGALTSLERLDIHSTGAGNDTIWAIRLLPNLHELDLTETRVTDACVEDLETMPSLNHLTIMLKENHRAGLSKEALDDLVSEVPTLKLLPRYP